MVVGLGAPRKTHVAGAEQRRCGNADPGPFRTASALAVIPFIVLQAMVSGVVHETNFDLGEN